MNNWEVNNFKTKEEATLYAIALTVKQVPGTVITWDNKTWDNTNFSKKMLAEVTERIAFQSSKKKDKKK